jgi:hypothetical protein
MAWTDTTPCSFCGREIPIFRRFGDGQFCSKAHQESALQQQNQLAVAMLHRTHDALKAYKPKSSSIEDILGLPSGRGALEQTSVAVAERTEVRVVEVEPWEFEEAAAVEPAIFHFGDSMAQLQEHGFLASLRHLWESLTARRT